MGVAAAVLTAALGACGGDDSSRPTLTWYINPDPPPPSGVALDDFGLFGIASRCSNERYQIDVEVLPQSATEQRIQLARRLASEDSSVDLMSLDPPFTSEFADAEFLLPIPADKQATLTEGTLQAPIDSATWEGEIVAAPQWANTQLLWYRKSFTDAAGLDMTKPVTWDQIIDAASENNGTVGVQANKYEGYVVWINALMSSAGGELMSNTEAGLDASVNLDSDAGREAARIIDKLASSPAAEPDLSVSNEGTVLGPFAADTGAFQVNWTFIFANYAGDEAVSKDLGWARYPQSVAGEESKPPIGGINLGIGAFTKHPEEALDAVGCIVSVENQVQYAIDTGNMPASEAAYDDAALLEAFPPDLLQAYRDSIDTAGPRPSTPYWNKVVSAILNEWHPADGVNPDSTPANSQTYVEDVLKGEALS